MWKGVVHLGRAEVAVKVHAGAVERAVHFRLIHRKDGIPVAQEMVDPRTGEPVLPLRASDRPRPRAAAWMP
jgi:non-homologous end joining protein Ku